jgi:hypothetical protein
VLMERSDMGTPYVPPSVIDLSRVRFGYKPEE